MSAMMAVLVVLCGACAFMALLYLWQRRSQDAGIVDVGWSLGIGIAVACYALVLDLPLWQRLAVAAVTLPWSLRLGSYLLLDRVRGKHEEDGRYRNLREHWGKDAQRKFFYFFQFQALLIVLFSLPPLLAMHASHGVAALSVIGVLVGWGALMGESVADAQLRRWRGNPANRGKTCRSGLWRYSRHPNYFFEWLHWWAYVVIAGPTLLALPALLGPALMLLFLYRITGIPYTEQQALKSRGEEYRAYQQSTSAFFPWFPKAEGR